MTCFYSLSYTEMIPRMQIILHAGEREALLKDMQGGQSEIDTYSPDIGLIWQKRLPGFQPLHRFSQEERRCLTEPSSSETKER